MPHRIVSLLPAATEIAAALGFERELVGRSHECDFPPGVATLPALTAPRLDPALPSRAIHGDVERLLASALAIYEVDTAKLKALEPTHVLTQTLCQVCAVSEDDVARALASFSGSAPALVSLSATTLDGVMADIQRVASALGAAQEGALLVSTLARRMAEVAAGVSDAPGAPPRVALLEWLDPPMGPGHWMPELVEMAGGRLLLGERGARSRRIELAELAAADPDVVVLVPCGFALERTRKEARSLLATRGFAELRAVRQTRVFAADGNALFHRPGPRLVETLEVLAELLHPGRIVPCHEGVWWLRLENE